MSADNGVYILETYGPEFRVAYHQNIDEIYGKFDDDAGKWKGNAEKILEYFEGAAVFGNIQDALDEAEEISHNYDYLEDGICVISDFKELMFNEL